MLHTRKYEIGSNALLSIIDEVPWDGIDIGGALLSINTNQLSLHLEKYSSRSVYAALAKVAGALYLLSMFASLYAFWNDSDLFAIAKILISHCLNLCAHNGDKAFKVRFF